MPYLQPPPNSSPLISQHKAASPYNYAMNGILYNGQTGQIIGRVPTGGGGGTPPPPSGGGGTPPPPTGGGTPPPPTGGGGQQGGGGSPNYNSYMQDSMSNPNNYDPTTPPPDAGLSPWSPMDVPAADYGSVRDFSDQAYQQARRHLDPMQDMQNRRLDQELINRGIDPRSEMGREMAAQMARQQADQNNSAMFGALGFGQGIQDQMYNQMMGRNTMELSRQVQDFNEMMGYDAIDYRNNAWNRDEERWRQGQMMQFMGLQNPWAQGVGGQYDAGGFDDWQGAWSSFRNLWGD